MKDALQATIEDIASMRVRGAAAIGLAGARALAEHVQALGGDPAQVWRGAQAAARRVDAARPSAVTLHNGLGWVLAAVRGEATVAGQRQAARAAAARLEAGITASRNAIAANGARLLRDGATVLTHCNSSTSLAVLLAAHAQGRRLHVIATETRPFRQGLLTVAALSRAGVRCSLIVDAAVGHVLATRPVDLVLVGADTVAGDGSLVNKVGTCAVAALAGLHGVPFYAAAGLHKFTARPGAVPIEERAADEVVAPHELPPGVQVLNPVFDVTPPGRVTGFVTERGLEPPQVAVERNLPALPPEDVWA